MSSRTSRVYRSLLAVSMVVLASCDLFESGDDSTEAREGLGRSDSALEALPPQPQGLIHWMRGDACETATECADPSSCPIVQCDDLAEDGLSLAVSEGQQPSRSQLGGRPALRFDGVDDRMAFADRVQNSPGGYTVVAVAGRGNAPRPRPVARVVADRCDAETGTCEDVTGNDFGAMRAAGAFDTVQVRPPEPGQVLRFEQGDRMYFTQDGALCTLKPSSRCNYQTAQEFTITAAFRPTSNATFEPLSHDRYRSETDRDRRALYAKNGVLFAQITPDYPSGDDISLLTTPITIGERIVVVWTGSHRLNPDGTPKGHKLYVNGVLAAEDDHVTIPTDLAGNVHGDGELSELAVYDRALEGHALAQVTNDLMQRHVGPELPAGAALHLRADTCDSENGRCPDLSGNGHEGRPSNPSQAVDVLAATENRPAVLHPQGSDRVYFAEDARTGDGLCTLRPLSRCDYPTVEAFTISAVFRQTEKGYYQLATYPRFRTETQRDDRQFYAKHGTLYAQVIANEGTSERTVHSGLQGPTPIGELHIVTWTADATGHRLYINGELVGQDTAPAMPTEIGAGSVSSGVGEMAEFVMYGRALQGDELAQLHESLLTRYDLQRLPCGSASGDLWSAPVADSSTASCFFAADEAATLGGASEGAAGDRQSDSVETTGDLRILSLSRDATGSYLSSRCTSDMTGTAPPVNVDVDGLLGSDTDPFQGDIAELMVFNRRLSDEELEQVRTYLSLRYGVEDANCGGSFCGDGVLDEGESCDDGLDNGVAGFCRNDCTAACPAADTEGAACHDECVCGVGQGPCTSDDQCRYGLLCAEQHGTLYGTTTNERVCAVEHCTNGRQDAGEHGLDCGGRDCAPCPDCDRSDPDTFIACSPWCPCDSNQGPCTVDADCQEELTCNSGPNSWTFCGAQLCGNGRLDWGEQCDPALDPAYCTADCRRWQDDPPPSMPGGLVHWVRPDRCEGWAECGGIGCEQPIAECRNLGIGGPIAQSDALAQPSFTSVDGRAAIRFDGNGEHLVLNAPGSSSQQTVFLVLANTGAGGYAWAASSAAASDFSDHGYALGLNSSSALGSRYDHTLGPVGDPDTLPLQTPGPHLLEFAGVDGLRVNCGTPVSTSDTWQGDPVGLAQVLSPPNAPFEGAILEALVFARPLNTQERAHVTGYLADRYELPAECAGSYCGDGVLDPGEQCEPGLSPMCSDDCEGEVPPKRCDPLAPAASSECAYGQVCGVNNGKQLGMGPGHFCWPTVCAQDAAAHCADADAPCGFCEDHPGCTTVHDCRGGQRCVAGAGPSKGLASGAACIDFSCLTDCDPARCGTCLQDECAPTCNGRTCGDDGCGGSCGECDREDICAGAGYCMPATVKGGLPDTPRIPKGVFDPDDVDEDPTVSIEGAYAMAGGRATYRVDLHVPPGRNGMQPALSIQYSSGAGYGPLGHGWRLGGLVSEIRRCPRTERHLRGPDRIRMQADDPLCLDGVPLVPTDNPPTASTEAYTFLVAGAPDKRVVARDYNETGPKSLVVYDGTGTRLFYGNSNESSDFHNAPSTNGLGDSHKMGWGLSEVFDQHGNYLRYFYDAEHLETPDGDETRTTTAARLLTDIHYNGHTCFSEANGCNGTVAPDRSVHFTYSGRTSTGADPRLSPTRLLESVQMIVADETIRTYRLAYDDIGTASRLTTLRECVPTAATAEDRCSAPTTFTYRPNDALTLDAQRYRVGVGPTSSTSNEKPWIYQLDANGDGVADVLHRVNANRPVWNHLRRDNWRLYLSTPGGPSTHAPVELQLGYIVEKPVIRGPQHDLYVRDAIRPVDVNGDSFDDLVVSRWDYTAPVPVRSHVVLLGDGNGGFEEAHTLDLTGGMMYFVRPARGELPDIYIAGYDRQLYHFENHGDGTFGGHEVVDLGPEPPLSKDWLLDGIVADWDHDGASELLFPLRRPEGGLQYHAVDSEGLVPTGVLFHDIPLPLVAPQMDFDGDGFKDIVLLQKQWCEGDTNPAVPAVNCPDDIGVLVWRSTPMGYELLLQFRAESPTPLPFSFNPTGTASQRYRVADFDGDGRDDLVIPFDYTDSVYDGVPTTEWFILYSRDTGFEAQSTGHLTTGWDRDGGNNTRLGSWGPSVELVSDFTGDGATDLLFVDRAIAGPFTSIFLVEGSSHTQSPGLLTQVTEGNRRVLEFDYADTPGQPETSSAEVYTPGARTREGGRPVPNLPLGTVVSARMQQPDSPQALIEEYRYEDARVDWRGWAGFSRETTRIRGTSLGHLETTTVTYDRQPGSPDEPAEPTPRIKSVERFTTFALESQQPDVPEGKIIARLVTSERERETLTCPTVDKGPCALPFIWQSAEQVEVHEEFVDAEAAAELRSGGYADLFTQGALSRTRTEFTEPDIYGNPQGRSTQIFTRGPTGTLELETTEAAYASHDITSADAPFGTVALPSKTVWTFATQAGPLPLVTRSTVISRQNGRTTKVEERQGDESGELRLTTEYAIDAYGNVYEVTETDPESQVLRERTIVYDELHLFPREISLPVRKTDSSGNPDRTLKVTLDIDPATGETLATVDPADVESRQSYDGFGRLIYRELGDGTATRVRYENSGANEPGQVIVKLDHGARSSILGQLPQGLGQERVFLDAAGNTVASRSRGPLGKWSQQDFSRDELGRVQVASAPHEPESTPDFVRIWSRDPLGRLVQAHDGRGLSVSSYRSLHTLSPSQLQALGVIESHEQWQGQPRVWFEQHTDPRGRSQYAARDGVGDVGVTVNAEGYRTLFNYNNQRQITTIIDPENHVTDIGYDVWGRRTRIVDPTAGERGFTYYGTGEVKTETRDGDVTAFRYDSLGRRWERRDPDRIDEWHWDEDPYDESNQFHGRLMRTVGNEDDVVRAEKQLVYDNKGLVERVVHQVDARQWTTAFERTQEGLVEDVVYQDAAGGAYRIHRDYDDWGHLTEVFEEDEEGGDGPSLWKLNDIYAGYLPAEVKYGDGIVENRTYEQLDHRTDVVTRFVDSTLVHFTSHDYWSDGSVQSRALALDGSRTQYFDYDAQNRLDAIYDDPAQDPVWSATYDGLGNPTYNSTAGTFNYEHDDGVTRPHAVASVSAGSSYEYDARGRVETRTRPNGVIDSIAYNTFDLPRVIEAQGAAESSQWTFSYGAGRERVRVTHDDETTFYAGDYAEISGPGDTVARITVRVGGEEVVRVTQQPDGDRSYEYLHRDRIGSVDLKGERANADAAATFTHQDHGPFGGARSAEDTWFAGHEVNDELDLVNMGGRFYDPSVGRFLTPDPLVATPYFVDALNRYSYVLNDPLNLVDPSGFQTGRPDVDPNRGIPAEENETVAEADAYVGVEVLGVIQAVTTPVDEAASAPSSRTFSLTQATDIDPIGKLTEAWNYVDRNHIKVVNAVGDGVTAWGDAVSFGLGERARRALNLQAHINDDSFAYQAGMWGSIISPGGWRTLLSHPGAIVRGAASAVSRGAGMAVGAVRTAAGALRSTANGIREGARRLVNALPVPGLGTGGGGWATVGQLRSASRGVRAGSFSVSSWKGYPGGLPKPTGPFRLLKGAEYDTARKAANRANAALRRANPEKYAGKHIHEIHPVKYGGSPTDPANKVALTPKEHAKYTTFWNRLMRDLK